VQWNVPRSGRLLGAARVEPFAAGGFESKGLWLDGDDWVEYLIEPQPDAAQFAGSPWLMTLAVEPTVDGGTDWWRLVTWPDGSTIDMRSDGRELRLDWGQTTPAQIFLSTSLALENGKWSTLALLSQTGSPNTVDVYVDGLRIAELSDASIAPFRLEVGDLRVGEATESPGTAGFKGWQDAVKIIGAVPTDEEVCNHAGGTLRGFDSAGAPADLLALASSYLVGAGDIHADLSTFIGALAGSPTSYDYYVCERPATVTAPSCLGKTHAASMPAECLRPLVNGLNQQLVWNQPRPDAVTNPFCLSCHVEANPSETMQPSKALVDLAPITMHDDLRRQPMQPFPLLFGAISADYFGPGNPGASPPDPVNVDEQTMSRIHI